MKENKTDSGSSANTTKRSGTNHNYSVDVLKKTLFQDELALAMARSERDEVVFYLTKRIRELIESTSR